MSVYKGKRIIIEIEGASHAPSVGVKLSGIPLGFKIDVDELQSFLKRRAPGQNEYSTSRREADEPVFLEGLDDEFVVNSNLIHAIIENKDVKSHSYDALKNIPRPGHADYSAYVKYGRDYDYRGGGQFSGRMTAPLCIAGGIAKQILSSQGINVDARALSIGGIKGSFEEMKTEILSAKADGDSVGGTIECVVTGMPAGVGGPMFDGLEGELSRMIYAIPAVKGVSFGSGFDAANMLGSENNDDFAIRNGQVVTETNNAGGILGGISNGMPIIINVAIKPTPSIAKTQRSINLETLSEVELDIEGRHDPCIVPRAVPCVEAATALIILDELLEAGFVNKIAIKSDITIDNEIKTKTETENQIQNGKSEIDLKQCRNIIDEVDGEILKLIEKRLEVVESVYEYKKLRNLPTLDQKREDEKLNRAESKCGPRSKEGAREVINLLMKLGRDYQEQLKSKNADN